MNKRALAVTLGLVAVALPAFAADWPQWRGPDVFLYDQSQPYDQLHRKYSEEVPQLAVEVLSPNDNWGKVLRRVTEFLQRGVAVVWVIDPENRTATVLLPNQLPQVLEENDEITGAPAFPDLSFRVAELFFVPAP